RSELPFPLMAALEVAAARLESLEYPEIEVPLVPDVAPPEVLVHVVDAAPAGFWRIVAVHSPPEVLKNRAIPDFFCGLRFEITGNDRVHIGCARADRTVGLDVHALPWLEARAMFASHNRFVEIVKIAAVEGYWYTKLDADTLRLADPVLHLF